MRSLNSLLLVIILCLECLSLRGQALSDNRIPIAGRFLTISPDAAGAALGNCGSGGNCDLFSVYYNPAKYAFTTSDKGVGVFYTPWSSSYARSLNLSGCTGYWRQRMSTFAAGFRYFSYGEMEMTDEDAVVLAEVRPYELAADLSYTLQLSPVWAGSVTFKYIHSYLGRLSWEASGEAQGAAAYAFDISFMYKSRHKGLLNNFSWGAGMRIENIGSRLSYQEGTEGYLLPAMLKLGASLEWRQAYHQFTFLADMGKLLVAFDEQEERGQVVGDVFTGMSRSLKNFSMQDFVLSAGMEYVFHDMISVRFGYNNGCLVMDNQRFFSFGCGGGWRGFGTDFAYLCYIGQQTMLNNMLKIACYYEF